MIEAKPTKSDVLIWWPVLFPLMALIATVPLLLAVGFRQMQHTGMPVPPWEFSIILIPGLLLGLYVSPHLLHRRYWKLTEDQLLAGITGRKSYPLQSLDRIVPGVLNQDVIDRVVINHRLAPVLRFVDGTLLSLNLHALPNGTRLMAELVSCCRERLDPEYEFSTQELKCLRMTAFNLEKKPK